jgi:hypothetical protein
MDLYLAVKKFSATGFLSESINFTHICCDYLVVTSIFKTGCHFERGTRRNLIRLAEGAWRTIFLLTQAHKALPCSFEMTIIDIHPHHKLFINISNQL